ncbi:MAG: adenylyltransferase/cytidyltransferase family protein, partial [Clostridia bacterium]|nr:adenylyltransferase/cytidyltransferase family protein [Clostridia bacterium]
MSRIGIFGGTFNPPHIGHTRLAEHFVSELKLDRLLVIPTYQPPHKS